MKPIVYLYLILCVGYLFVEITNGRTLTQMKEINVADLDSTMVSAALKRPGYYVMVDSGSYYAFSLTTLTSLFSAQQSNQISSTRQGFFGTGSISYLAAGDGTDNSNIFVHAESMVMQRKIDQSSFYKDYTLSTQSIAASARLVAGDGNYFIWFDSTPDFYFVVYRSDTNTRKYCPYSMPLAPTSLACDFNYYYACFIATQGVIYTYNFTDTSLISSAQTGDLYTRIHGVVNPVKKTLYFCRNTADGFVLEVWNYLSLTSPIVSKEFSLVGSCKSIAIDTQQGQVFVLTPTYLLAMDYQGENVDKTTFDGIDVAVSLDIVYPSSSIDNLNYLLITKTSGGSTNILPIQYNSYCQDNCNNNGNCTYGTCICASGGSSCLEFDCQSTTSSLVDDKLFVTIKGLFPSLTSLVTMEMGGIKHVISSYNTSYIEFIKTTYTTHEISFYIKGVEYNYTPTDLYPIIVLGDVVQQDEYIFVSGNTFASWYQYQTAIGSETTISNEYLNSTTIKLSPKSTIYPSSSITLKINDQQESSINLSLSPFIKQTNPSTLSDKGELITISGSFFGSAIVYLDGSELESKLNSDNDIVVELPNGIYSSIIIGNGVKNTTLSLKYSNLSIDYVSHSSVDTLTIYASNFGIISNDVEIQLADEVLVISSFNASIGQIKVKLTSNSIKGNLVIKYKTQSISIGVNLKPHINSINPTTPSSDGDTITVTGSYLQSSIIELTNNNIVTTLTCTTLSTTSQSCNIIKGTGIFTITSTSSSPRIYQDPLISNPYSSIYKSSSSFSRVDSLVSNSYECTYKSNSISPSPEPSSSPSTCPTLIPSSSPTPSPSPSPSPSSSSLPTSSPSPEQSSTPSSSLTLLASSSPSSSPSPSSSVGEPSFSSESSPLELSTIESISNEASYKTLSELGSIKTEIIQESLAQSNQPSIYHLLLLFLFILL